VFHLPIKQSVLAMLAVSFLLEAGSAGSRVLYAGGTVSALKTKSEIRIDLIQDSALNLNANGRTIQIPYKSINTVEYGLHVSRRYVEAVLISPVFLVAKRRSHFLTIGYQDPEGLQQAMVLQVNKADIRALLVSLEARTGLRVEYQDEEARKAGKG